MAATRGGTMPDAQRRATELARLRRTPGRRPVLRFVRALRDPAFAVAKTATMGLCDREAILEPLADMLADDGPNLRWRACSLAWFFRPAEFEGHLVKALRDPDRMVRTEAAWCATAIGGACVKVFYEEWLKNEKPGEADTCCP